MNIMSKIMIMDCTMLNTLNMSPIKLHAAEIKFDTGYLFMNGKNHRGKTPLGEFKATTPKNLLLSKQAVTSKGIPVSYTNL